MIDRIIDWMERTTAKLNAKRDEYRNRKLEQQEARDWQAYCDERARGVENGE